MSPCPACGHDVWRAHLVAADMYTGDPYTIIRCSGCGLARTSDNHRPPSVDSYRYGGKSDAGKRFGAIQWLPKLFRSARARRFLSPRAGLALDIGCGDGTFLETMRRYGWEVYGTELSESIAATAREVLGDRVHVGGLHEMGLAAASSDLITFWHVLEHLDAPDRALLEARRLVKAEGRIVVAVPNIESWQARLFKEVWLHLDVPRHRWHFSPRTLGALADRCGLRVEHVRHLSLEYGPVGILQGIATKLGLGHSLFTRLMRESPVRLLREPLFWAHIPVLALGVVPSLLVEAIAALCRRGGTVELVLRPKG